MRTHIAKNFLRFLTGIIILILLHTCSNEEIVIVYSKIKTLGTSNITSMTADVEGNIEELTEADHDEYGICWDTVRNPTVYHQKALMEGPAEIGTYSISLYGLKPSTTYYARAFVKDNKKYIYGSEVTFITLQANLPVVTTASVTGITSKYASSGGNVTQQGDKPVIAKGVCFDTVSSPTVMKNKTVDGWGTGSFTSPLADLKPSRKYYVRAYAMSEFGVSYGSELSFTTEPAVYSFHEEYNNNENKWHTGTNDYGEASVTGGQYVIKYKQTGYLWRVYNYFPDFKTVCNNKDFEITTRIRNSSYGRIITSDELIGALVWDSGNSGFKFFGIARIYTDLITSKFYYTIGSYDGSYTTWKAYTEFTGSDYNILTIKKGGGYYYFFVNDVQVHKQSFTSITNDGVGFFVQNSEIQVDYIYLDQKGDKKAVQDGNQYPIYPAGNAQNVNRSIKPD